MVQIISFTNKIFHQIKKHIMICIIQYISGTPFLVAYLGFSSILKMQDGTYI
ncbi:hypothetical protein [Plasmodium yoelii yoelii]|uniref:Uncharacterized protein n=1 Tax=Plasmodium yoelii yoelii TaxID=73239 RepID=Q7R9I4_PLAYO|nr:hypothetical protein [Plasmodium yoelii yoelii]